MELLVHTKDTKKFILAEKRPQSLQKLSTNKEMYWLGKVSSYFSATFLKVPDSFKIYPITISHRFTKSMDCSFLKIESLRSKGFQFFFNFRFEFELLDDGRVEWRKPSDPDNPDPDNPLLECSAYEVPD